MNIDVAQRLIDNLENKPIKHDQGDWLKNGRTVFVIYEDERWSCATSGCAAGFLFLAEAPEGSVFDINQERVFSSEKDMEDYLEKVNGPLVNWGELPGRSIVRWGADTLDITFDDAWNLFYDFGETDHIVHKIMALMEE